MEKDKIEQAEVLENEANNDDLEEEQTEEEEIEEENEENDDDLEVLKLKLKKAEEEKQALEATNAETEKKNKQLYTRLKKSKGSSEDSKGGIAQAEEALLISLGITNDDDMKFVKEKAEGFKITLREAVNDSVISEHLKRRQEERKSVEATPTEDDTVIRRKTTETLIKNADKGEFPDNERDLQKMLEARLNSKFK